MQQTKINGAEQIKISESVSRGKIVGFIYPSGKVSSEFKQWMILSALKVPYPAWATQEFLSESFRLSAPQGVIFDVRRELDCLEALGLVYVEQLSDDTLIAGDGIYDIRRKKIPRGTLIAKMTQDGLDVVENMRKANLQ